MKLSTLFASLLCVCALSCKTFKDRDSYMDKFETKKKDVIEVNVSALYTANAIPFEEGFKPKFNLEKLVSKSPLEEKENLAIEEKCVKKLNEIGFKVFLNDPNCKDCQRVKLGLEIEDKGFQDSTFMDCSRKNQGCSLFVKNYRSKIQFVILNNDKSPRHEIKAEALTKFQNISDVTSEICEAAFSNFPEIRSNKIYEIERK